MKSIKLIVVLLVGCLGSGWPGANAAGTDQDPAATVHFEPGKADLRAADKSELHRLFETYAPGAQGRVFVVGFADVKGAKADNYKLSRQRAETVRREIVSALGIDAGIVMALGKGSDNPVAENRTAKGRALNRRAEVYVVNGELRKPQRAFGPDAPNWSDIQNLVHEAEESIKAHRLGSALQKLKQAHALGADNYADWHAVRGIAGYYAAAPQEETHAHLVTALNLDPYNFKAREYLSRMEARQKVARKEVTKDMGRTLETAIGITTVAQQYEYLGLFEVQPLVHREMEMRPVDMWQCVDRQGAPVVYYFNRSQAYRWAFARSSEEMSTPGAQAVQSTIPEQTISTRGKISPSQPGNGTRLSEKQKSGRIRESKIFK